MVITEEWDPRLGPNTSAVLPEAGSTSLKLVLEPEKRNMQGVTQGRAALISTKLLPCQHQLPG